LFRRDDTIGSYEESVPEAPTHTCHKPILSRQVVLVGENLVGEIIVGHEQRFNSGSGSRRSTASVVGRRPHQYCFFVRFSGPKRLVLIRWFQRFPFLLRFVQEYKVERTSLLCFWGRSKPFRHDSYLAPHLRPVGSFLLKSSIVVRSTSMDGYSVIPIRRSKNTVKDHVSSARPQDPRL
jgi:hypothetical protein